MLGARGPGKSLYSEQRLDLVALRNVFSFENNFMEIVMLELLHLHSDACKVFFEFDLFFRRREAHSVQLFNVLNVVDGEAFLEFLGKFRDVLFVAEGQDDTGDVVIFACCKLLANSTNTNHFAHSGDFYCHGQVRCNWSLGCHRNKSGE